MSHKAAPELSLIDPYALERERAVRQGPKPEGNEAVWDDFSRWVAQSAPSKPQTSAAGISSGRAKKAPHASLQQSHNRERDRLLKTNLSDHKVGGGRSSSGRTRSLVFWVPVIALAAWYWFGRG